MDLGKAIKSVNILNIDWDESTASNDTFLLKEKNDSSFIISDADEEILILIEFVVCVDLHNIIFTALPLNDNFDTSPPKEICLYKAQNICVNFDDMSSLSADKVIEGKAKKLSKGQKVSLRKKLAFRQIKYLIIYVRANQNDSEKTHLHKIKINGICDAKLSKKEDALKVTQQIKQSEESSRNVIKLFKKQQSNKMSDEALSDYIYKQYGGNISNFLNDCHQFIKNMDSNRSNMICSKNECVFLKRRHRFKRSENVNNQSMIEQRMRQIHILCHQYDEEEKMKNDKNYRRQIIKDKKTDCEDMDEKEPQSNKFVTDIEASSASLMNEKYLKYSPGFKFYYHSFYKDKDAHALGKEYGYEIVQNNYYRSSADEHWSFKYWYVSPKYRDLKEEIVGGDHLTKDQFENELSKADKLLCTDEAKKLVANSEFEEQYKIQSGSAMTVYHMLCVMLYTNYDVLQNKLSKTFRKASSTETNEQLKRRHASFFHLSQFLTEAIWCFGSDHLNVNVYHGVNRLTIFRDFTALLCGPTSTTTSECVAINFATNNGTVITMQGFKDHKVSNHFDCELWSDYPWEKERLFIGMTYVMDIVNVNDLRNAKEYEEWINAIRVFTDSLMNGEPLTSPLSQVVEENVRLLIESVKSKSVNSIPEYIVDTFNHIRMNRKNLKINLYSLSNDIYWRHKHSDFIYYGGNKIKDVYFDKKGNMKWTFINLLFPKLSQVHIFSMIPSEEDPNIVSFSKSILLTDDVLNDILVFLKVSNIGRMQILSPQNNLDSLKQQIAKFSAEYEENGYHLETMQSGELPRYLNQCTVFVIKNVKG